MHFLTDSKSDFFGGGWGRGGGAGGKGQWIYKDQSKSELFWRGWGGGERGVNFFLSRESKSEKNGGGGLGVSELF